MPTPDESEIVFNPNPFIIPVQYWAGAIDKAMEQAGVQPIETGNNITIDSIHQESYPAQGWNFCRITTPHGHKYYFQVTDEALEDIVTRLKKQLPLYDQR